MPNRLAHVAAVGGLVGASVLGGNAVLAADNPSPGRGASNGLREEVATESAEAAAQAQLALLEERLTAVEAGLGELDQRIAALAEREAAADARAASLEVLALRLEATNAAQPAPAPAVQAPKPAETGADTDDAHDGCGDGQRLDRNRAALDGDRTGSDGGFEHEGDRWDRDGKS